jgi:hypothetical protein
MREVTLPIETRTTALDFESFFRAEYRPLCQALILLVGDPLEADEIAQETMTRVLERWDRVGVMDSPAPSGGPDPPTDEPRRDRTQPLRGMELDGVHDPRHHLLAASTRLPAVVSTSCFGALDRTTTTMPGSWKQSAKVLYPFSPPKRPKAPESEPYI